MGKYAPLILKRIATVVVGDGTVNKLSGKDLVDFFNEFGFNDDYVYPNVGISTADLGNGLSRTDYTRKRLKLLNERQQIDEVLSVYTESCVDKQFAEDAINGIIGNAPTVKSVAATNDVSFQPKSQFDDIQVGVPTVFISYSWDDDEHKRWVRKLADDLRDKYNICSLLDQYEPAGADLVEFMNKGIGVADRVLMIGTPLYKQKSESGIGSGGKYEGSLITIEIYHNTGTFKYIPLLRRGNDFKASFLTIVSTRKGFDFRDDSIYEDKIKELVDEICVKNIGAPALSRKSIEATGNMVDTLPVGYKGERWLYELLKYFSFYLMDGYFDRMPCRFDMRVITMFDAWDEIIRSSVYHINDEQLRQVINDFYLAWREICEYGVHYYSGSNNGVDYVFYGAEFDIFVDKEHENAFEKLKEMIMPLYQRYKKFVSFLDSYYPKIDREKVSIDFVRMLKKEEDILSSKA